MKIGIRKINIKNRIKSRTTAKLKRKVKSEFIPWYGKKGMGWVNDPHKALYNKIYNKTTISAEDALKFFTQDNRTDFIGFKDFYYNQDKETKRELKHLYVKLRKEHNKKQWEEIKEEFRKVKIACKETLCNIRTENPKKYYKNLIGFRLIGVTFVGLIFSCIFPVPVGVIFFPSMIIYLIVVLVKFNKINKKYKR